MRLRWCSSYHKNRQKEDRLEIKLESLPGCFHISISCGKLFFFSLLIHFKLNINNENHSEGFVRHQLKHQTLKFHICHNHSGCILPTSQLYFVFIPFLVKMNNKEYPTFPSRNHCIFLSLLQL